MSGSTKIVVGIDGSDCSRVALRWAAEEARRRVAELVAVVVCEPPMATIPYGGYPNYPYGGAAPGCDAEHLQFLEKELDRTITEVLGEQPSVKVIPRAVRGNPAQVLIDLSHDADLVVVGTRGHGGFMGKLLGSVSRDVSAHSACTAVVVRDH
jgi:nucleotide-binding universal stress UspA family protein